MEVFALYFPYIIPLGTTIGLEAPAYQLLYDNLFPHIAPPPQKYIASNYKEISLEFSFTISGSDLVSHTSSKFPW